MMLGQISRAAGTSPSLAFFTMARNTLARSAWLIASRIRVALLRLPRTRPGRPGLSLLNFAIGYTPQLYSRELYARAGMILRKGRNHLLRSLELGPTF